MFGIIPQTVKLGWNKPSRPPGFYFKEAGATAVEYGLLLALIAAVIIGTVALAGLALPPGFQAVVDGL